MSDLLVPIAGFKFTPTACLIEGEPSYEAWGAALAQCEHAHRCIAWWIGDLLNYGELRWGDTYTQAVQATGNAVQTLTNYKAISKAIPPEQRIQGLSYSAHRVIAFSPKKEEALEWARGQIEAGSPPTSEEMRHTVLESPSTVMVRFTCGELAALLGDLDNEEADRAWDKMNQAYLRF